MLHIPPTNCLLLTAKQEPYKKAYLFTKNIEEFSGKKFRRKGQQAENDKTERVTAPGRRTREEIAKWNQMTALRFQTGGRHQTSTASLRGESRGQTIHDSKDMTISLRKSSWEHSDSIYRDCWSCSRIFMSTDGADGAGFCPRLRGFWENVGPFIPRLRFFVCFCFVLK